MLWYASPSSSPSPSLLYQHPSWTCSANPSLFLSSAIASSGLVLTLPTSLPLTVRQTLRMLGIRLTDPESGFLTPTHDSATFFSLFTNPSTAKRASDILTRLIHSLTLFSPVSGGRTSFLRHVPSTIGFLVAAHNERLVDFARGGEGARGMEREWGVSVLNKNQRDELLSLISSRADHTTGKGGEAWGLGEYNCWVVRQSLLHGTLRARFGKEFTLLEGESKAEAEERWVKETVEKFLEVGMGLEEKEMVARGLIERPAVDEVEEVEEGEEGR